MKKILFLLLLVVSVSSFASYQIKSMQIQFTDGVMVKIQKDNHVTIFKDGQVTSESWFGANGYEYWPAVRFAKQLQKAVRGDDVNAIAGMLVYPLKVYNAKIKSVANKSEFIKLYPQIFTKKLRDKVLAMNPYRLFCNSSGVMLLRGEIWLNTQEGKQLKIYNVSL